jgi:hypothetical protein
MILYELWVHVGFSSIWELSNLLTTSSSCGCDYYCPTSPSTVCLPIYDKYINKLGQSCPSTCTDNGLSCDSNLACIPKTKPECQYGLYDLSSTQCLFLCPNNSCHCPTLASSTQLPQTLAVNVLQATLKYLKILLLVSQTTAMIIF